MRKNNWLRIVGFVIGLGCVIFSGWKLYSIYSEYAAGTDMYENLADAYVVSATGENDDGKAEAAEEIANSAAGEGTMEAVESYVAEDSGPPLIDFAALKETCADVVAWIYCADTPINYPVVQAEDNDYYLYRLLDGRENKNGTLFLDFRNSGDFTDWNNIIYGHNMNNDSMFGIVPEYMEQDFYEEHPIWYLLTESCNYRIELIGGYVTPADSDTYTLVSDSEAMLALADKALRNSSFKAEDSVETVGADERLITLSTCVYDYENARYVLVGVLRTLEET